ncbi:MAG: retropepsin-like aspartic protease [Gallionella sp.]|nr:retropepsin-like aspartic protease [Gallionella sp.]
MNRKSISAAIIWLVLSGALFYLMDSFVHPNKTAKLGTGKTVVLQRGLDSHYRTEAFINGIKVNMLVDTGATDVAISRKLADKLGLKSVSAIRTTTANGDTVAYMARLDKVKLGGIEARDVAALITPNLEGDVLLGMSFMNRMDVHLYQGTMTITQVDE